MSDAPYFFIRSSEDLKLFCNELKGISFITVDTEFKRERTFWPQLCLIQVASPEKVVLIDPLRPEIDLTYFYEILSNPHILKVFHAGYEDMEIFFRYTLKLPFPLFDTQIAAQFCGFGDSVGYHTLVKSICGVELDKSQQRTDWTKRPLSEAQKEYAGLDVFYLREIYDFLKEDLQNRGRLKWAQEEIQEVFCSEAFQQDTKNIWTQFNVSKKKPQDLCLIKELADWRERRARINDLPRAWVISNSELMTFVEKKPATFEELLKLKSFSQFFKKEDAKSLLTCLNDALKISEDHWPSQKILKPFSDIETGLLKGLKTLLETHAKDLEMSPSLIATRKDLEDFIKRKEKPSFIPKILRGWRQDVFGKLAATYENEFFKKLSQ